MSIMSCSPGNTGLDEWMGAFSSSARATAHRWPERTVSVVSPWVAIRASAAHLESSAVRPPPLLSRCARMIPFSVLDLSPVARGSTPGDSLRHSRDLARHAESLGFHRYWLAEHH